MNTNFGLAIERRGEVLCLMLDRPRSANALDAALQRALVEALAAANADASIRAVMLTAAGERVFSAGADLKEFSERDAGEASTLRRECLRSSLLALAKFDKPLLAVVRGKAIGAGCMLALLADEIHAAAQASFSLPEIRLGMATPVGAVIVAARGGRRIAQHMTLTGEPIDAQAALAHGLVDTVHAADRLDEAAMARAHALAALAGPAYAQNKHWINSGLCAEIARALDEAARLHATKAG